MKFIILGAVFALSSIAAACPVSYKQCGSYCCQVETSKQCPSKMIKVLVKNDSENVLGCSAVDSIGTATFEKTGYVTATCPKGTTEIGQDLCRVNAVSDTTNKVQH